MKKLIIFIGLELAEILGVCGIIGFVFSVELTLVKVGVFTTEEMSKKGSWVLGWLLALIITFIVFAICFGIYRAIKANWAWADRISRGKK